MMIYYHRVFLIIRMMMIYYNLELFNAVLIGRVGDHGHSSVGRTAGM